MSRHITASELGGQGAARRPVLFAPGGARPVDGSALVAERASWVGGLVGRCGHRGLVDRVSRCTRAARDPQPVGFALFLDPAQWQTTWNNASATISSAVRATCGATSPRSRWPCWCCWCRSWPRSSTRSPSSPTASRWWRSARSGHRGRARTSPDGASVVLAAMSVFFTTVVGCLLGLRAAPRASLDLVRAYGGTNWTKLRKVQLIAALPSLFAALKIAAPAAFLGARCWPNTWAAVVTPPRPGVDRRPDPVRRAAAVVPGAGLRRHRRTRVLAGRAGGAGRDAVDHRRRVPGRAHDGDDHRTRPASAPVAPAGSAAARWSPAGSVARCRHRGDCAGGAGGARGRCCCGVRRVGVRRQDAVDVWHYLFSSDPPRACGPRR